MTTTNGLTVRIQPNERQNPPGKLADAELHFTDGPLAGTKLIGFAVWERRGSGSRNVTFPARQYSVNGERRSFALLRPSSDAAANERVRDLILGAYAEYERSLRLDDPPVTADDCPPAPRREYADPRDPMFTDGERRQLEGRLFT